MYRQKPKICCLINEVEYVRIYLTYPQSKGHPLLLPFEFTLPTLRFGIDYLVGNCGMYSQVIHELKLSSSQLLLSAWVGN